MQTWSMQTWIRAAAERSSFGLTAAALLAAAGCSAGGAGKPPDVDPQAASAYAMEHYDANHDGVLEPSELSRSAALAAASTSFDADGNGRLAAQEITDGLTQMYASGTSLAEVTCTVTLQGRPLAGAKVRLSPIEMVGDALPPAEGVTNQRGTVRPSIDAELIPEEFRHMPLMYPGLYRVEITHPRTQLSSRYNTATELGGLVEPAARAGMSLRFDLKSK
jgi:hypothetical protein